MSGLVEEQCQQDCRWDVNIELGGGRQAAGRPPRGIMVGKGLKYVTGRLAIECWYAAHLWMSMLTWRWMMGKSMTYQAQERSR